jgi:hypothetical protein
VASAIVAYFNDMVPERRGAEGGSSISLDWFRWLSVDAVRQFYEPFGEAITQSPMDPQVGTVSAAERFAVIDRELGERLAALDQMRTSHRTLRAGWLFVAGHTTDAAGHRHRVFQPLITIPVRIERVMAFGRTRLVPAGDAELTPLITDRSARRALEDRFEFGGGALDGLHQSSAPKALLSRLSRLRDFALNASAAAGWDATAVVPAGASPDELLRSDALVVVAGVAVYAEREGADHPRDAVLESWRDRVPSDSALTALYLPASGVSQPVPTAPPAPYAGPFALSVRQEEALERARTDTVSVVAGAAGTGKSHTIAAIVCDAIGRGESVLVAAKSDATVDALLDLLGRAPGLEPVVFGSDERRDHLAARLATGQHRAVPDASVEAAKVELAQAVERRRAVAAELAQALAGEAAWEQGQAPAAVDPDELDELVRQASATTGWRHEHHAAQARARLRELVGSDDQEAVERAAAAIRAHQRGERVAAAGGLDLRVRWAEYVAAVQSLRRAAARHLALAMHSSDRLSPATLPAIAALATALRNGRSARRVQLARLRDDRLTTALPLWVGTLDDVEDLLPPVPRLFDVVLIDEASSVEQPLAAPALLRAARAVIVGDPRQLRHVSFVSDGARDAALLRHGLDSDGVLAARLDVRRNSLFDVATGATQVVELDEEFRSVPHLVRFLGERVYEGCLRSATVTPANEERQAIEVVPVEGVREKEVVGAEVRAVVRELRNLRSSGHHSVGVITPFRRQADAIEEAVLQSLTADDIEALDLRIGTVHGFQGNEREIMLASIGLDRRAPAGSWQFVDDEQLFTVLVSRARRRLVLFLSAPPPPGLLADYLADAAIPPSAPTIEGAASAWDAAVATDLAAVGVPVRAGYPFGRDTVDVSVGDRYRFAALDTSVHRDGPEAHIRRRLALSDAGWDVIDAFRSAWHGRTAELAIEISAALGWPRRDGGG